MKRIAISDIRRDGGTQTRDGLDHGTVKDYAEAMEEGAQFPPITVYHDGTDYWLADGFHRVTAAKQIGTVEVEAEVIQGSRRDAILHSVGANTAHGLRRSNQDKRRAVETLLRDDEWSQWSDNEIARRCAVSPTTVGATRRSLSNLDSEATERTYTTKHGTTATMKTENIGKTREEVPAQERAEWYEPEAGPEHEPESEPFTFDTTVDEAIADIKQYISDILDELSEPAWKHSVANEIVKHARSLSIKYNQEA